MVDNCSKPQSVNLVTHSSRQNIPHVRFQLRYFRFAIQLLRVLEFYGFGNILFTSLTDLEYGNGIPRASAAASLIFLQSSARPDFFSIFLNFVYAFSNSAVPDSSKGVCTSK